MNYVQQFIGLFNNKQSVAPLTDKKSKDSTKSNIPTQLHKVKQDTTSWKEALEEAERWSNPYRVKLQRLYNDTILNSQVAACIERRKDLTLLRSFYIFNQDGTINQDATDMITEQWFQNFMSITLDSLFFGYSLISLGDIVDNKFNDIKPAKRWLVSPDRFTITENLYNIQGIDFRTGGYEDWNIYVPTNNITGSSNCGVGLLYLVGLYEIFLRNNLGYNADYVELFSQPYRVGRTDKTDSLERDNFELMLAEMGSSGYALMDSEGDSIEFLETSNTGGYEGYANLEERLEKKISKILLGHSDALDSIPGQLGNLSGSESPVYLAMLDKKTKDGNFVQNIINSELIPRMRKLGYNMPIGCYFNFKNDEESNKNALFYSDIAAKLAKNGIQMDPDFFTEQTGILTIKPTDNTNGGI